MVFSCVFHLRLHLGWRETLFPQKSLWASVLWWGRWWGPHTAAWRWCTRPESPDRTFKIETNILLTSTGTFMSTRKPCPRSRSPLCSRRRADSRQKPGPTPSTTASPRTRRWPWTCSGSPCTKSSRWCCCERTHLSNLEVIETDQSERHRHLKRGGSTGADNHISYLSCCRSEDTGSTAEGLEMSWRDTTWSRPWWCCSTYPPRMTLSRTPHLEQREKKYRNCLSGKKN